MGVKTGIFLGFFLCLSLNGLSQTKTRNVVGEYRMRIPDEMSVDQAKRVAVQEAKLAALAAEFGTMVGQSTRTKIVTNNGETSTRFASLSNSFVNGVWVADRSEPSLDIIYEGRDRWIECKVKGEAKPLEKAPVNFTAKPVSCLNPGCATQEFKQDDLLYLYFKSPVDGYLSVYLDDEKNCQMLLPYQDMKESVMEIEADKEYYLFSSRFDYLGDPSLVDEYPLYTNYDYEVDLLYVIFSTKKYFKADMYDADAVYEASQNIIDTEFSDFPKFSPSEEFQTWLTENLIRNDEMYLEVIDIAISK